MRDQLSDLMGYIPFGLKEIMFLTLTPTLLAERGHYRYCSKQLSTANVVLSLVRNSSEMLGSNSL